MAVVYFVTHPEVVIDPSVPVPDWPLSPQGVRRMVECLKQPWLSGIGAIYCSAERKATDAAGIVADHLGLAPVILASLGENDRSATGYLEKSAFEAMADAFFANPHDSVRGWERAIDAQRRVVGALDTILDMAPAGSDIAILSHGGVGALLLCHLKGVPIARAEDQPGSGGGNVYAFDAASRRLLHGWRRMEH